MQLSRGYLFLRNAAKATKSYIGCIHCFQNHRKPTYQHRKCRNLHLAESALKIEYAEIKAMEGHEHLTPLFIHHGLFGSKQNWRSLSKAFNNRTGRRVIVVDARNHGESEHHDEMNYHIMANDAWQLISELDLKKVIFIGHSMGGKVAMTLALTHPQVIHQLIVEDSAPADSNSDTDMQRYIAAKMKIDLSAIKSKSDADKQLLEAAPNPMIRQFFLTNLVRTDSGFKWRVNLEAIDNSLGSLMGFPSQFPTEQYDGPTLFIGGGRSDHIQEHHYHAIYRLFPKAKVKFIADSGHWIHSEKPVDFLNMVLEFISEEYQTPLTSLQ